MTDLRLESEPTSADTGERFDPFCHTLDDAGRALCFADLSGRRVHKRNLGTAGSAGATHCQTCQKAVCPTCAEIERQIGRTPL